MPCDLTQLSRASIPGTTTTTLRRQCNDNGDDDYDNDDQQRVVNAAARISTGYHSSTPVDELAMEAQLLPIKERLDMLAQQSLVSALRPDQPSHAVVTAPRGPRQMKQTLASKHNGAVASLLTNNVINPATYRDCFDQIHSRAVAESVRKHKHSRVLDSPRPAVSPSESTIQLIFFFIVMVFIRS